MALPRILLADDHTMLAESLALFLKDQCELVGIVQDGAAAIEAVRKGNIDVLVIDISMPQITGLECLRKLQAEGLKTKSIVLTMHKDAELACEALRSGASGFLLKHAAGEELVQAIREVMQGRLYLSKEIASDTMAALASPKARAARSLSPRQLEVLRLVAAGRTMKEIAAALKLSRRTVESHKYEMMQTLGVSTTAELIHYAFVREEAER
jgi:DNA-binding NarL/FixJ family response regulator